MAFQLRNPMVRKSDSEYLEELSSAQIENDRGVHNKV